MHTRDHDDASVPDLTGLDLFEARALASRSQLRVAVSVRETKTGPWGRIVSQYPEPGVVARAGSRVLIIVTGRPHVTVPETRGTDPSQATERLEAMGLVVARRLERTSSSVPPGRVIGTTPRSGSLVVSGCGVTINVSRSQLSEPAVRAR